MAYPDMWSQKALVTLTKKGSTDINYQTIIDTIDIDEGEQPVSEIMTVAGGRLIKIEPQVMTTVTLEAYPVGISIEQDEALGFSQLKNGTSDTTQPLSTSPTHDPDKYRCAIMWTTDATITQAVDEIASGSNQAYRWYATDCYLISNKKSYTDKGLKHTIVIKCPQYNKAATALIVEEDTDGSATLSALSTYS